MKFPIKQKLNLPEHINGLGDVVKIVAEPIKQLLINTLPESVTVKFNNCNCDKRRQKLNKLVSFT